MTTAPKGSGDAALRRTPHRSGPRTQPRTPSALPDEIVQCSIRLFNRDGPQNVSTNVIAADLGISSGNLHYHFRTKQDLGRALYALMEGELRHALRDTDSPATVSHLVERQIEVQRCLWRHRYFFASFDLIVRKDAEMRERFEHLQQWAVTRITHLLNHYTSAKVLRPIEAPNTVLLVAQNTWMLWISWVRWEVVMGDRDEAPRNEEASDPDFGDKDAKAENVLIHRLVGHHFSSLATLMPRDLATEVSGQLDEALLAQAGR